MQRTKAKMDKEFADAADRAMYTNEISDQMKNCNSILIIEPSIMRCANLKESRFSFGGMNREIESLLEKE